MKRLMQEALDNTLDLKMRQELWEYLDEHHTDAHYYTQLKQVDQMLKTAPHERAPARLAMTIMARLAEEVRAQAERSPDLSRLALTLGLALVTVVMMPMLIAASWLVINAAANPMVLTGMIEHAVALLVVLIRALQILIKEAESLAATDPHAASAALSLVPLTLLGFVNYMEEYFVGPVKA
jgi:hypothetical protein